MPLTSPSGRKRSAGASWELNSFGKSDINVWSSASLLTIEPRKKSDQLIKVVGNEKGGGSGSRLLLE